jgi:hypothetical protein
VHRVLEFLNINEWMMCKGCKGCNGCLRLRSGNGRCEEVFRFHFQGACKWFIGTCSLLQRLRILESMYGDQVFLVMHHCFALVTLNSGQLVQERKRNYKNYTIFSI